MAAAVVAAGAAAAEDVVVAAAGAADARMDRSFRASGFSTSPGAFPGPVDISRARRHSTFREKPLMRWKVGIAGQQAVLHQLAIVVSNDDMRLEVRDDLAFLSGARLDALSDIASVQREAERIVTIMSAFARLLLGVTDSLRVVDVAETPAPDPGTAVAGSSPAPASSDAGTSSSNGAPDAWPRSSLLQSLRLVLSNPAMEQALSLRDTSRLDGTRLSQICRIIESAAGRPAVTRFSGMSQTALQRLHAAASLSAAEGNDAGDDAATAEGSPDRMTLAEARSLVDRLLMAWVGSVARHTPGLQPR